MAEEGYIFLPDSIRDIASRVPALRLGIGRSVHTLPPLKLDRDGFTRCLAEIFSNAMSHGVQEYVGVQAKDRDEAISLRFKNRIASSTVPPLPDTETPAATVRGGGLLEVEQVMQKEGIAMRTGRTEKISMVELLIPKSKFYRDTTAASA